MRLAGHGLTVELPPGWEGTIGRRPADPGAAAAGSTAPPEPAGSAVPPEPAGSAASAASVGGSAVGGAPPHVAPARPEEQLLPVAHLATFPLPVDRGDFGSGAVDLMGAEDVFVAVVEYGPECANTPLFAAEPRLPQLKPGQFGPARLQRVQKGQAGAQTFCTVGGRAFCIYAVVGSADRSAALSRQANAVIAATEVGPSGPSERAAPGPAGAPKATP